MMQLQQNKEMMQLQQNKEMVQLQQIKGVGIALEKKLQSLGIFDIASLIERLPKSYIDLSKVTPFGQAVDGSYCLLDIEITGKNPLYRGRKTTIFTAEGICENTNIKLNWYNTAYPSKILQVGQVFTFYGKIRLNNCNFELNNPSFEKKSEQSKFSGIQPIYATKGIIYQKNYHNIVKSAMDLYNFCSVIDSNICLKHKLMSLKDAYYCLHFPQSLDIKKAKERVVLEKVVRRIGAFALAQQNTAAKKTVVYNNTDIGEFIKLLPYQLNSSQTDAINEIKQTLQSSQKLNAILCGDVGSGKTVVAAAACFLAVKNNYQAAFMAPTEILANQHYENLQKLFTPLGIKCCLLTGSCTASEKNKLYQEIALGNCHIVVGTHSLINENLTFAKLQLIIADEQHRFGVAQRTKLINKAQDCDVLTLSATPIPRSLQLIAYGKVQTINLQKRFLGNVSTKIVYPHKRQAMWQYIFERSQSGSQTFIVAPKIFDIEGQESESAHALFEELKSCTNLDIGLLHGKLKPLQKQKIIDDFVQKKIAILVATTVIEVGIDVPNADIMVIMDAEKFGLSTLHQLRGRVGRDGKEAYCFLYTTKQDSKNLEIMTSCSDGIQLAEHDFAIRGGGELIGLEQSGSSSLGVLTLRLINKAKKISQDIDFEQYRPILEQEIQTFSLYDVSLN